MMAKPTAEELSTQLGVQLDDLPWRASCRGDGMFEVAIVRAEETWVLIRLQSKAPDVQVFDVREWRAFLDGVRKGEFDDLL